MSAERALSPDRLGHRKIAHIAGPQDVSTGLSRYQGFLAAMSARGLTVDQDLVVYASAYSLEEGDRCCRALLAGGRGCTAIAAANDMLAVGCYTALEAAGLSCPGEKSVGRTDAIRFSAGWRKASCVRCQLERRQRLILQMRAAREWRGGKRRAGQDLVPRARAQGQGLNQPSS
jgi:DNA-binding LacI/PurR family transcriptional regulator